MTMTPVRMRVCAAALISSAAFCAAVCAADLDPARKSAICQTRAACTIGKVYDGGRSASAAPLIVVEVHLGLTDKPDDAPDEGCHAEGKFDGGVEYWLLEGAQPPKRLLKFCNDGYGAAGVGEDDVTVESGKLIHRRVGGSAWRWESATTYTLSPWRAIAERDCSFNDLSSDNGSVTDIDFLAMTARSITKDRAAKWGEDVGCPQWPANASAAFTPHPAPNLLGAYNVLVPAMGADPASTRIPSGTAIGDCVPPMTTAGANGFVVFGDPAPAARAAEVRAIAESFQTLVVQVFDPAASPQTAAGGSWINLPHVEIWIGLNTESSRTRLPFNQLAQFGVDLNGKVYPGVGRKEALPRVERWPARDAAGHPVVVMRLSWPNDTEFVNGVAVVYSQAEAGKQKRMAATTAIVRNRPLFVPDLMSLPNIDAAPPPGKCQIRAGLLSKVQ